MATPMTAEHRAWRARVFIATWLSYVGYYFCRRPWNSAKAAIQVQHGWSNATIGDIGAAYVIAYALGQFLASRTGPAFGPRRSLLVGMGVSIVVTVAMGVSLSPWTMGGLIIINGVAQATGWSGNVGTMANWFHRHERGRVMGAWTTNLTVGSVAAAWVLGLALGSGPLDSAPWQRCYFVAAAVLTAVWLQFFVLQRTRPEDVGLAPIDDPQTELDGRGLPPGGSAAGWRRGSIDESKIVEPAGPAKLELSRDVWINLCVIGGFYFFAKVVRYAIWGWAQYFLQRKFGLSGSKASVYATAFDLCGIPGVYVTGWLSDRFFGSRRAGVALLMMLGMTGATGALVLFGLFGGNSAVTFAVLLGVVGFFLYGPDSLLTGAGAMDIGNRRAATFAAAFISGIGSIGPVIPEVIVPRLYDENTGSLGPVYAMLFVSAVMAAVFCAVLVIRNRRGGKGI